MPAGQFAAFFGERIGYKSGLALTREEIVGHLGNNDPISSVIVSTGDIPVPVRASDVEDAFQRVLHALGTIPFAFVGHGPTLLHTRHLDDPEQRRNLDQVLQLLEETRFHGGRTALGNDFDRDAFYRLVRLRLPTAALDIAAELLDLIDQSERASPWNWIDARHLEWKDLLALKDLFASESLATQHGSFLDQRFVDYLASNFSRIDDLHWRKLEGLAAEFYARLGYDVAIGPGRADGGVDVRAWKPGTAEAEPPLVLVQCKRQREKVGKTVVKALWADVVDEKATSGLIVTTSALAPGADAVRRARGYAIDVADRSTLREWLEQMRTPGRGIFLGV